MKYLAFFWLAFFRLAGPILAQGACPGVRDVSFSDVTSTTATVTFQLPSFAATTTCSLTMRYSYVGGSSTLIQSPSSPVHLTGLEPNQTYTIYLRRLCRAVTGPACSTDAPISTPYNFTTASILATQAATKAGNLTLAPNPTMAGRTTLTLATPLPHAQPVSVHDALGRVVRQLVVPAATKSTELNLTGLPAGVYVVRCGSTAQRLVME